MWALPGNQFCYPASSQSVSNAIETLNVGTPRESILLPGILSKGVEHNRNVECGHSQGIDFVTRHLSQSVSNTIGTKNVGTPRESTLLPGIHSKRVKHHRNVECGQKGKSSLLPGILSNRVKHNRIVECGHSQGISFVTRHPPKACKT
jgi:hypothetical protein